MRQRHALYLSAAMTERLKLIAETRRLSKSEILERALQAYLGAEADGADGGPTRLLALQQERNERALGRLERDVAIATELLATFVRYFVTITPPLPATETEAARALGQQRFRQVVAEIARRLNSDDHLIARVLDQLKRTSTQRPPAEGVQASSKSSGGEAEVGATRGLPAEPGATLDSRTILEPRDPC
jgi:hypothetical protein